MDKTFTIYTEPHNATVGNDVFQFEPEVDTPDMLEAYAVMIRQMDDLVTKKDDNESTDTEGDDGLFPVERQAKNSREATDILRMFLGRFMLPESAEIFAAKAYPDRVLGQMRDWLLETYGLRPTTSSVDSSESSPATTPAPGSDSTEPSPSEV